MVKPVEPRLLSGAPVSVVADGQFVGGAYPLPVSAFINGHTISTVVSEISDVEGSGGDLRFNRPGAGGNLNRFALRLPQTRISIDGLRFHFVGWTPVNAFSAAAKAAWRTTPQITAYVLESPYKTYQEAVSASNANTVNRWTFLDAFFATSEVYENLPYNLETTRRDLFVLSAAAQPFLLAFDETKQYRYAVVILKTTHNQIFAFDTEQAYAYFSVGWSPRMVSVGEDLASGSN